MIVCLVNLVVDRRRRCVQLLAEFLATFFLMFTGLGAITVEEKKGAVTFPGVAVAWGAAVMAMVYAVGHVSGAHLNPAVTLGFAVAGRFPWRRAPAYALAQTAAATAASVVLRLMFGGRHAPVPATLPGGANAQSLVIEFVITFYLMFVIMAVATDDQAVNGSHPHHEYLSVLTYRSSDSGFTGGSYGWSGCGWNHHAQCAVCWVWARTIAHAHSHSHTRK